MNLAKALKEAEASDAIWRETNGDQDIESFEDDFIQNDIALAKRNHPTYLSG